jgi:hypothetical protein
MVKPFNMLVRRPGIHGNRADAVIRLSYNIEL